MSVRDGAASLARCLGSVAGFVDQITVGDTGSSDRSREIAASYGARVIELPWSNDFAQARNAVLAHAVGDWILVLDADEMLDDTAPAGLAAMLRAPGAYAYQVSFRNYLRDFDYQSGGVQARANQSRFEQARSYPAYFWTNSLRLFRRDPRIYFSHCVHETVVDSLCAAALPIGHASFVIHHFGHVEARHEKRSAKDALYYRLALKKLVASPNTYEANMEAGIAELDYAKRAGVAFEHFTRATQIEPAGSTGWLYRGICLSRLGRWEHALQDLSRAAQIDPANPLVHSAAGDVNFHQERYAEASAEYRQAQKLGDASALTLAKSGAAEIRLGQFEAGMEKLRTAVEQSPGLKGVQSILMISALLAGGPQEACQAAVKCLRGESSTAFHFLLAATIHSHAGELTEAELILEQGLILFPEDQELRQLRERSARRPE